MVRTFVYSLLLLSPAMAATVTLTDANADYYAIVNGPCNPGGWQRCGASGYLAYSNTLNEYEYFTNPGPFNTGPIGEETFASGFAVGAPGWSLENGGTLDNLLLSIVKFDTFANQNVGGVEILVTVAAQAGYAGPALNTLYWVQALTINYRPGAAGNQNYNTLDHYEFNQLTGGCNAPGGARGADATYCGPVYPYQYANHVFYDRPKGIYAIDSFRGIAMLASVDDVNKKVTVYNGGVNYGFDLFVPEPGTWALMTAGLAALVASRRRIHG